MNGDRCQQSCRNLHAAKKLNQRIWVGNHECGKNCSHWVSFKRTICSKQLRAQFHVWSGSFAWHCKHLNRICVQIFMHRGLYFRGRKHKLGWQVACLKNVFIINKDLGKMFGFSAIGVRLIYIWLVKSIFIRAILGVLGDSRRINDGNWSDLSFHRVRLSSTFSYWKQRKQRHHELFGPPPENRQIPGPRVVYRCQFCHGKCRCAWHWVSINTDTVWRCRPPEWEGSW